MDPADIGLFRLAERRMAWIDQRQTVLAQNVANANTPGYKATDVASFDASLVERTLALTLTAPNQLSGRPSDAGRRELPTSGKSPNGNTVVMEDQLGKIANTSSNHELVTDLYRKYEGLFQKALGVSG